MKSGKIVLGLLAGIAIGSLAGVLFAPEKGSKTRKNIVGKSDAYKQKLGAHLKGFVDGVAGKFEAMTEEAEVMAERGADKVAKGMDHLASSKRV